MRLRVLSVAYSLTAGFGACFALYRWGGANHDLAAVAGIVQRGEELSSNFQTQDRRYAAKRDVAAELIAGSLSLREAASQFHRLVAADPSRFPPGVQPPNDDERWICGQVVDFAWIIFVGEGRFAEATRWHAKVFADHPHLLDPADEHFYQAAICAVRAGAGQGDAADLDEKGRAGFRRQALDWLRADLKTRARLLETGPAKSRWLVLAHLQKWLLNPAFEGVPASARFDQLPEAERRDWRQLWAEVEALRQHAIEM